MMGKAPVSARVAMRVDETAVEMVELTAVEMVELTAVRMAVMMALMLAMMMMMKIMIVLNHFNTPSIIYKYIIIDYI